MTVPVILVAGARPNFMKVAPLLAALRRRPRFAVTLVHTGQHYDDGLSDVFFRDLGLPAPDINLDVRSGSHGAQTARVLERFETVLLDRQPALVMVVGDVNSTLACALAAAKVVYPSGRRPKVAHVEAGLRSFDWTMPEEINRVLTDRLSDFLFTTEESANVNLLGEGIPPERVHFVGNVMIDTLLAQAERAAALRAWEKFEVDAQGYAVVTLHRPSNVEDPASLRGLLQAVAAVSARVRVVFPVHPRTAGLLQAVGAPFDEARVRLTAPLGYVEFLSVMTGARLVLTDSGGIQEETTILGIPCVTLRESTERPVTVSAGTNTVVGTDPRRILDAVEGILAGPPPPATTPPLWDGKASERIVEVLERCPF